MTISAVDLNTRQKRLGRRALAARKWFDLYGPPEARPLPLGYDEREALKRGGLPTIVALYARSLEGRDYDLEEHPSFDDYACGVMASDQLSCPGAHIQEDEELQRRFPPRQLKGLGPGLYWQPPAQHAETMAGYRRSRARAYS
jgi:hypothetical protein